MRRREFITLLGGAAAAWPLTARAQPQMQVIGLLNGQSSLTTAQPVAAFRQGLADAAFVEGRNLAIVYRWADGDAAKLPALAAELVRIPVAAIVAVGGNTSVLAAKAATTTIPIVFTTASDPVEAGLVTSLNRPGGNVTGVTFLSSRVAAKQIGLLRDMVPKLKTIGYLTSPLVPMAAAGTRDVQAAAEAAGLRDVIVSLESERDIDAGFETFVAQRVDAAVLSSGAIFGPFRDRLVTLAARHAIPMIYTNREYPEAGGLISYGGDIRDAYRQVGLYVGRILRGDKAGDLPVLQPTRFELVINMKTVKSFGLTVPPGLLAIADEVIE